METWEWIVFGLTMAITLAIVVISIALQFRQLEYTAGGRKLRVTTGLRNYHLFLDDKEIDSQISWFTMGGVVLQHREENLDILVRVTRGVFRPRITCKVNGEMIKHISK